MPSQQPAQGYLTHFLFIQCSQAEPFRIWKSVLEF